MDDTPPNTTIPRRRLAAPRRGHGKVWLGLGLAAWVLGAVGWALWLTLPERPASTAVTWPSRITVTRYPVVPPQASPPPGNAAPQAAHEPVVEESAEMTRPDPGSAAPPPPASAPPAPPPEIAAVTVAAPALAPPAKPGKAAPPPWLRFAVHAPPPHGRPRIAIVIDDLGLDRKRTERTITLPGPLTLSFLAYANDLPHLGAEGHRAGHELMLHVPMEPMSRREDMGPNGLAVGLGRDELLRRLRWDLARFDGYVGINNHMGSRFTSDAQSLLPVMEELKQRGLLFLDSRTISNSAGLMLAKQVGVPSAARDVFLDNEVDGEAIAAQLAETEAIARRHGSAIAIGHPHDATIDELQRWLPTLPRKGFELVPVSALVREAGAAR